MNPFLSMYLMVGNVGSGKSTRAAHLKKELGDGTLIVSHDAICRMLNLDGYGPQYFTHKHWPVYQSIKKWIVTTALKEGFDIIIDGSHMTKVSRQGFIRFAGMYAARVEVYCCYNNFGLQRRIDADLKNEESWRKLYTKFAESFEKPEMSEGIDQLYEIYNDEVVGAEGFPAAK